tara:strand:+ start:205 stop:420 length:216 start_codon:yes stop_codon:yes gene_type:complete
MTVTKGKFKQFVIQQRIGKYNMFDPRARALTDLNRMDWTLSIKYYKELYAKHITAEDEAEIQSMIEEMQDE